jgi:hypothetical protein
VTVVAASRIADGEAHAYVFPLPPSLAGRTTARRVTLTLAWLTPINAAHHHHRRAALSLTPTGSDVDVLGSRIDLTQAAARRGTLQHEVLEGARAVPYVAGASIELVVSCRADAGALDEDVPYGLVVSVAIPAAVGLPIYEEVRQALQVEIRVRAPAQ